MQGSNRQWHIMNDEDVIPCPISEALKQKAYILFYTKDVVVTQSPPASIDPVPSKQSSQILVTSTVKPAPTATATAIKMDVDDEGAIVETRKRKISDAVISSEVADESSVEGNDDGDEQEDEEEDMHFDPKKIEKLNRSLQLAFSDQSR